MAKDKSKTELFEAGCQQIRSRDIAEKKTFNLKGNGRDKVVTLKGPFSTIASKYLVCEEVSNRKVFSWQQVTDACINADLFVTDVVSKQL